MFIPYGELEFCCQWGEKKIQNHRMLKEIIIKQTIDLEST
jgi:hypothetical protein